MRNRLPIWEKCLVAGIIAIAGIVMVLVVKRESVTMDQVIHITAGVSYLQQHEERLNLEHPPLEKILAAFPLAIAGTKQDYELVAWQSPDEGNFCWATMRGWGLGGERKIFLARLPMIALTLVFAFTTFWMARTLGGSVGGMVSLLLFVTSPFFLCVWAAGNDGYWRCVFFHSHGLDVCIPLGEPQSKICSFVRAGVLGRLAVKVFCGIIITDTSSVRTMVQVPAHRCILQLAACHAVLSAGNGVCMCDCLRSLCGDFLEKQSRVAALLSI